MPSYKTYLNDFSNDYKTHLQKLQILPLVYIFNISDVMLFINSLKFSTSAFDIRKFIHFTTGDTHLATSHKLQHSRSSNSLGSNFYFQRLPRIWNTLPIINCEFHSNIMHAYFHFYVHAIIVTNTQKLLILIT